jgi:hypothetical protein
MGRPTRSSCSGVKTRDKSLWALHEHDTHKTKFILAVITWFELNIEGIKHEYFPANFFPFLGRVLNCYQCQSFLFRCVLWRNRDSAVSIVTGYGLESWGAGVRVPVGGIFPLCPSYRQVLGLSQPPSSGCRELFPRGWSDRGVKLSTLRNLVDLYIHSPIRLHGLVLNWLSTRTALLIYVMCMFPITVRT